LLTFILQAIVEGDPPDLPEDGYSNTARDFVRGCLNKIPKQRPTYAMLLKHPWLQTLSKPQTITEEAEEGEEADEVAAVVGKMSLTAGTEDAEVAAWVNSTLKRKAAGMNKSGSSRPALHAAPLNGISPVGSPAMEEGIKTQ
jgi:mitogen-activated protein kinase kinase